MPRRRVQAAITAVLTSPLGPAHKPKHPPFPASAVQGLTPHSFKRFMPAAAVVAFPRAEEHVVDTGAWSGSELAAMSAPPARGRPASGHRSAEG